jgi:hypothetical protein
MTKACFCCNEVFGEASMKTSRSRFKIMGLRPPEGMGGDDRICLKCLNKIHNDEIKRIKISQIRKNIQNTLQ